MRTGCGRIGAALLALLLTTTLAQANGSQPSLWSAARHQPSNMPLEPWRDAAGADKPFATYVADTLVLLRQARQPIEPDPSLAATHAEQVGPHQWSLDPACGGRAQAGVLLVHGLSDSPYLMRDLGNALARLPGRCLLVRSILLPGHGSIPGDLIRPTATQWRAAVRYGLDSFAGEVPKVHIAGFSTGAALALDVALNGAPPRVPLASLVLLSPSIGLTNRFPLHRIPFGFELFQAVMSAASGFGPEGAWLRLDADQDFAKAESFPVMAPRPLMEVMSDVEHASRPLSLPVLMAFSADDVTVDPQASLDFFRNRVANPASRLLLYASPATLNAHPERYAALDQTDSRITCRRGNTADATGCHLPPGQSAEAPCPFGEPVGFCVSRIGHNGVPIAPSNPHYGVEGDYRNCLGYATNRDWDKFCGCVTRGQRAGLPQCQGVTVTPQALRFSEITPEALKQENGLVARIGFNPLFDSMIQTIDRFLP